ncbi:MAG: glycosyltransferase 2 family protein [Thermoleophilaceae bacterium]|nr:glycosyltransferase 2 family protein [Thermoleophilaceae bacterium]
MLDKGWHRRAPLQIVVTIAFLGAVVWWASRQGSVTIPTSGAAMADLASALGLYAIGTLGRAERWHRILLHSGLRPQRRDSYGLTLVGYMANNVLPARSGELLRSFLLAPRVGTSKRTVLGSILAERILDAAALGSVLVVLAFDLVRGLGAHYVALLPLIGAAAVGLAVALYVLHRRGVLEKLAGHVRPLLVSTRSLASLAGVRLFLLSLGIWIIEGGVYLLVARAVGIDFGIVGALTIVGVANLFTLIPAAPGYVGSFDFAVLFSLKAVAKTAGAHGLSYVVLLRFVLFVPISVVGLIVLVVRYGGLARLRSARAAA